MRHVLIASLGGTPQVITETLWALMHPYQLIDPTHRTREAIIPGRVHIIATNFPGHFASLAERDQTIRDRIAKLYSQYGHPAPEVIIEGVESEGEPLADIRTQSENIAYADHIARVMKAYSEDPEMAVHMSLAGGRKSMSSYDHSAMMFFGRVGDELSHVLVELTTLENSPQFWWPDQDQAIVTARDGAEVPTASEIARLDLVHVPFVRLGVRLPSGVPDEALDYARLVEYVEFERRGEPIIVDWDSRSVTVGTETAELEPLHFMFFSVLALARKNRWPGAGPQHEDVGENTAGWILLDDLRCGCDAEGNLRRTRPLKVFDSFRQRPEYQMDGRTHREDMKGKAESWYNAALGTQLGRVGRDPTTEFRSKTRTNLGNALRNPFIVEYLLPTDYKSEKGKCIGLNIPPERLVLRGFRDREHDPSV
jgi:CRISPR-associated protein (TIGR02584 family)